MWAAPEGRFIRFSVIGAWGKSFRCAINYLTEKERETFKRDGMVRFIALPEQIHDYYDVIRIISVEAAG